MHLPATLPELVVFHRTLDEKIRAMEAQRWLTSDEATELRVLKKHKLAAKERLMQVS